MALAFLLALAPFEARAWSEEVFAAVLKGGGWHKNADDNIKESPNADDNVEGASLSAALIQKIVTRYRAQPENRDAQQDLGLFALAMGIAQWGVADPAGLPEDPRGKKWASRTGEDSGKHLMGYAVGGIGIFDADVDDLEKFIRAVADSGIVPSEHRQALLRLANKDLYRPRNGKREVLYDQIRAAGACASNPTNTDLDGQQFVVKGEPPKAKYCADHVNKNLTEHDWRVFRTWMRAALRTRRMQEWLAALWMDEYWSSSLKAVPPGPGYIEEAIVNARVRNSWPIVADGALERPATTVTQRVQRELDAYGAKSMTRLKRRCRIMRRPVVLYRYFAGEPELQGIRCPPRSD